MRGVTSEVRDFIIVLGKNWNVEYAIMRLYYNTENINYKHTSIIQEDTVLNLDSYPCIYNTRRHSPKPGLIPIHLLYKTQTHRFSYVDRI